MNQVNLIGRLTVDPEVKVVNENQTVANLQLAVPLRGKDGKVYTDFIPCVAWNKLAEVIGNNLTKGRRIRVTGRLHFSRYEEPDGRKRTTGEVVITEVEFLDKKQSSDAGRPGDDISQETLNSTVMCGFGPCTVFDEREFGDEIPVSGI